MVFENEIHIEASPATVWRITKDVHRWPDWCPNVESVTRLDEGLFGLGSSARIKQNSLPPADWLVTAFSEGKSFTWETRIRGIKMAASHEIVSHGTTTKNVLRLEVTGILALLLQPLIRASARTALQSENLGLKQACESATISSKGQQN